MPSLILIYAQKLMWCTSVKGDDCIKAVLDRERSYGWQECCKVGAYWEFKST